MATLQCHGSLFYKLNCEASVTPDPQTPLVATRNSVCHVSSYNTCDFLSPCLQILCHKQLWYIMKEQINELVWELMNTLTQNCLHYDFMESFKTYIDYKALFLAYSIRQSRDRVSDSVFFLKWTQRCRDGSVSNVLAMEVWRLTLDTQTHMVSRICL